MAVRIDRRLNIVFPIERESGPIYVHATPISRETFERYFVPISKTFAAIYAEGLNVIAGPRIAALMLKRIATEMGTLDGPTGVRRGLLLEMQRLANVVLPHPSGNGWGTMPLHDAIDRELLDEDDVAEVEGVLAFFTCVSAMHTRAQLPAILAGMSLWQAQTSSLNSTEFANSLQTSTPAESSGGSPVAVSSLPF
jgi:hypothetical protein